MPRPPILPPLDFSSVFASGITFKEWIAAAESAEAGKLMEAATGSLPLDPELEAALKALSRPVHVIAFAEDWCGDVQRFVPVLERLAAVTPQLRTRYLARADNPTAFQRYLTNGGEAVPKFVFFNHLFVECGNWGPMPDACRKLIARGKAAGDVATARKRTGALCDADPECRSAAKELAELVFLAASEKA